MPNGVLIVAETHEGALRPASLELVSAGIAATNAVGGSLIAVVLGQGIGDAVAELAGRGAHRVMVVDHGRVAQFTTDAYAFAVEQAIRAVEPRLVIFTGTTAGRDLAPRLSARFDAPLAANVTAISGDAGEIVATRPGTSAT